MTNDKLKNVNSTAYASLPAAAKRWLERALPENSELPTRISIQQEGSMDIRGRWTPFKAIGIYEANPLSFEWQARLNMLPGIWIKAEDGHKDGKGWGGAKLWGIISMGMRTDPEVLQSQLVRNLGELPWFPALALSDSTLIWTGLDESSFEVRTKIGEMEVAVQFEINDRGDVIRAYSPARVYDLPDGFAEAPWFYEFSDHQDFDGVRMPAAAVGCYEKSEGTWEYIRARIISATSTLNA
jgi:hypothetical protein